MSRVRRFVTMIAPAMLAGGLLFGPGFGHAAVGDGAMSFVPGGANGASSDAPRRASGKRTAQAPPAPPMPPMPPSGPRPPSAQPPSSSSSSGRGVSVRVHGGKVKIEGLENLVRTQLTSVREMIRNNPQIPPDVRAKVLARLDQTRGNFERRLRNMSGSDIDAIENEMEKLGEELERSMEGLEEELSRLGDKLGKDLAKSITKDLAKSFGKGLADVDTSDDEDDHAAPDVNVNVDVPTDLRGITLKQSQREQIAKLRAKSDREIAEATKQLTNASRRLEAALADPNVNESQISNYVDEVSRHEARIRKARLLTWVNARRVLDDSQRRKIEAAAKRPH